MFDLPFILPNKAALRKVTDGALGKKLMGLLQPKGIVGLAYWDNGFKDMSANKPLRMPDDFSGLKMRIQSSKVLEAQMRALGAIPQVMAFSEVYQALQTGVVDGTENPPSNEYTQKIHEVQKYTTLLRPRLCRLRGHREQALLGRPAGRHSHARSKRRWRTPRPTPTISRKRKTTRRWRRSRHPARARSSTLTPEQKAAWQSALEPVYAEIAGRVGKDIIAEFKKEVDSVTH